MAENTAVEGFENMDQVKDVEQIEDDMIDLTPKHPVHVEMPPIEHLSPSKPHTPPKQSSPTRTTSTASKNERWSFTEEQTPLRDNEGLTGVIKSLETENESLEDPPPMEDEDSVATIGVGTPGADVDDTRFSTFSAVPNADMTLFARLGQTPGWGRRSPTRSTIGGSPVRFLPLITNPTIVPSADDCWTDAHPKPGTRSLYAANCASR